MGEEDKVDFGDDDVVDDVVEEEPASVLKLFRTKFGALVFHRSLRDSVIEEENYDTLLSKLMDLLKVIHKPFASALDGAAALVLEGRVGENPALVACRLAHQSPRTGSGEAEGYNTDIQGMLCHLVVHAIQHLCTDEDARDLIKDSNFPADWVGEKTYGRRQRGVQDFELGIFEKCQVVAHALRALEGGKKLDYGYVEHTVLKANPSTSQQIVQALNNTGTWTPDDQLLASAVSTVMGVALFKVRATSHFIESMSHRACEGKFFPRHCAKKTVSTYNLDLLRVRVGHFWMPSLDGSHEPPPKRRRVKERTAERSPLSYFGGLAESHSRFLQIVANQLIPLLEENKWERNKVAANEASRLAREILRREE